MNKPKLTIVGQGAIGLLFARMLKHHFDIQLLVRGKQHSSAQFECIELNSDSTILSLKTVTLAELERIENVLLPIKAYQVNEALEQLTSKLSPDATVIVSHNGMPNISSITSTLKKHPLYFLTTSMAALKLGKQRVKHTGIGPSAIGSLNHVNKHNSVIETLLSAVPHSSKSENIIQLLWQKLLINIAINPLSAHHQVNNGALTAPQYASDVFALLNEAVTIAQKEGVTVTLSSALENAYQVMRATSQNYSSMNRDVFKKQHTEIDSICGYITKKGVEYNYPTPVNQRYLTLIQGDIL